MKTRDLRELVLLAAVWGASFLFMRLGAGEFGAFGLALVRAVVAAACLVPVLAAHGQMPAMRSHWRSITLVGLLNSALPFALYAYAATSITAGLSSILNATTPLWTALVAALWLRDRLTPARMLGLAIGFAGVIGLAWDKASFKPGGTGWAVAACLAATLLYGIAGSVTKRRLQGVPPLAVAAGSQVAAAAFLCVPAATAWPAHTPSVHAWLAALALGVLCTGLAYLLWFRLIAHVGPGNAASVTFLIPGFAVLWGWLFLSESITASMIAGCAVIVLGTLLATGLWQPRLGRRQEPAAG